MGEHPNINIHDDGKRICLFCSNEFTGRPDKKFCHYNCRNGYNNKKYRQSIKTKNLITYS